jgi:hypothetical protein
MEPNNSEASKREVCNVSYALTLTEFLCFGSTVITFMSEAMQRQDAICATTTAQHKALESATTTTPTTSPTSSILTTESTSPPTVALSRQQQPQSMSLMMIVMSVLLVLVLLLQLYILVELRGVKEALRVGSCPSSSSSWSRSASSDGTCEATTDGACGNSAATPPS